jgi:hypothetical protein
MKGLTSSTLDRASKIGMNIRSSLSFISSYQLIDGRAFSGWKRYAVGEFYQSD